MSVDSVMQVGESSEAYLQRIQGSLDLLQKKAKQNPYARIVTLYSKEDIADHSAGPIANLCEIAFSYSLAKEIDGQNKKNLRLIISAAKDEFFTSARIGPVTRFFINLLKILGLHAGPSYENGEQRKEIVGSRIIKILNAVPNNKQIRTAIKEYLEETMKEFNPNFDWDAFVGE